MFVFSCVSVCASPRTMVVRAHTSTRPPPRCPGTKLLGALYGAGPVPTLDHNRIFAKWIQKRVVFRSDNGEVLWSSASAVGPNVQVLRPVPGQDQSFTGRFHVYDVDHVDHDAPGTLLHKSPVLTVRPGEVWELTTQ